MSTIVIDMRISRTTTGRYIDKVVEYLQKLDTTNEYILLMKSDVIPTWKRLAKNFSIQVCDIKEFSVPEQTTLLKTLRSLKPNLVFFPMTQQPIFYRGKVVTTINDLTTCRFRNPSKNPFVFWFKQRVYIGVTRLVAKKSVRLLTYSHFVKNDVVAFAHVPPEKITVAHLAADTIREHLVPLKSLAGKRFLFYTGRPQPHKNLERLIEAHQLLRQTHPDLQLVLGGRQDELFDRLEKWVAAYHAQGVIFTGFVSEGQLRWLYEHCEAYVFPSLSEGFGLPGLEAMLAGASVVSSNATCLPEVYGEAAEYFNPRDIPAMAASIARVIDDPSRKRQLIKQGSLQVKKYSWLKCAEATLNVLKETLTK